MDNAIEVAGLNDIIECAGLQVKDVSLMELAMSDETDG